MAERDAAVDENGDNEVAVTRMSLRPGGWVGYSEEAVFVDRGDERLKIDNERIVQVGLRVIEWDLVVMSILLVGIGGYVTLSLNPLVGVAFAVVGALSLYYTYRQRYELVIEVENEIKPVTVHPSHPKKCHETLVEQVGLEPVR
jgi:hypothetical protein